ncbi:MAG: glycosyltransferase, partial [Bacteroidales bacterium]|nr:glycosyltransferase [Bacteroidales bacterium]
MPLVSIVIPVYKAEDLLPRCLDSILAQTMLDWECVMV